MPALATRFGALLYDRMAPYAYDDPNQGYALLAFCDAFGELFEEIFVLSQPNEDNPYELVNGSYVPGVRPGWADLFDIDRCPASLLPYLGQYVGVRIPQGTSESVAREMVRQAAGIKRGSRQAMVSAGEALVGVGNVRIQERRDQTGANKPYHITVYVPDNSLPPTDVLGTTTLVEDAVRKQKPAGLILHFVATSVTWNELTGSWNSHSGQTWDTLQA